MTRANKTLSGLDALSFTATRKNPKPGQWRRCFWSVAPATGDYNVDREYGQQLALEYINFEVSDRSGPGYLNHIISDMPKPLTNIEISFLQVVGFQIKAGGDYASRLLKHWADCEKEAVR